jgi:hypothetical protein
VRGAAVGWTTVLNGHTNRTDLPPYAFSRGRFWLHDTGEPTGVDARLWSAVEAADPVALAAVLGATEDLLDPLRAVLPALLTWRREQIAGLRAGQPEPVCEDEHAADPQPALLRAQLLELGDAAAEEVLLDLVRTHTAMVLGLGTAEAVDVDAGFLDIGMTSFTAMELRNAVVALTGVELSAVVLMDNPSPRGLVALLRAELIVSASDPESSRPASAFRSGQGRP